MYGPSWSHDEATQKFRLSPDRDLRFTRMPNMSLEDAANAVSERAKKTEQIRQYVHATFEIYEKVYAPLNSDESYTIPPVHKLRHPLIFYLGHTATFYMNKLTLAGLTTRINPKYEETFAVGVDEMSWDDLNEAHYDWPTVAEVWNYRRLVRERIDSLFDKYVLPLPLTFDNSTETEHHLFYWAILMGIEHERIHLETASVHVRELPLRLVSRVKYWDPCMEDEPNIPANEMVAFEGGKVLVGRQANDPAYGWDCDYSNGLTIAVEPFKASKYIVTNKEFWEFVQDGGYTRQELWDEEGWNWVSWKQPQHPWFWVKADDGSFRLRTQCLEIPLPWSWPCEVNHLEATAFCAWKSLKSGKRIRLPTEAEWLHMWDVSVGVDQRAWENAPGNVNLEKYTSSCPGNKFQQGQLFDLVGNVWQHCETPVYPYKGYKVHPLYDDFSMPTFDGRHRCMKGGAWISTGNEASRDARFAFRRHFFQFIGIRYIEGVEVHEEDHTKNCLGMDPEVDLIAHKSFSPVPESVPVTPRQAYGKTLAQLASSAFKEHSTIPVAGRALDLLCGAGRASYELSLTFKEVTGVDFSARTLQPAYSMKERGLAQYSVVTDEATGARKAVLSTADGHEWASRRNDVVFYQSDPANLHAHLSNYDLILAFNIQDQSTSYDPSVVPRHLISRLNAGGILFVAEPVTKMNPHALEAAQYIEKIADVATVVVPRTVLPIYMPNTEALGRIVEFEIYAFRKN